MVFLIVYAVFVFFAPNYLGEPDNYIPANPLVTPDAHRAGMVLPAVLRHPARRSPTSWAACWPCSARSPCCSSCRGSTPRRVRSCTFRPIYKWFMFVLVIDVHRAGRLRRQSAGRLVRAAVPARHGLLLLPLPHPAAGPGQDRTASAIAAQHRRCGAQEEGGAEHHAQDLVIGRDRARRPRRRRGRHRGRMSETERIRRTCTGTSRGRSAPTTAPPRSAAIQVYHGGLRGLSFAVAAGLSQPDGARADREPGQGPDQGHPGARPRRRRPADRAPGAPVGPLQEAVPQRPPPRPPPTTARRRPTSASSSRRARTGRTTSTPC